MFNNSKLSGKVSTLIILISIIVMSLLPFLWLPKGYMVNSEDQLFMNYEILFDKASYAWTNFSAFGSPATAANHSLLIPNAYFYKTLKNIGLSTDITQKLFMTALIFSLLVAFWLFASLLTKKKHIIFLALLAYFLNFYISVSFTYTGKMFQIILTPLLFYFTYKYLETKKLFYIAIHFIILFIFQGIFTNLTQLIALLPIYIFSAIFFCLQNEKKIISTIKSLFLFFLITIPIYVYHALVYYFSLFVNLSNIKNEVTFSSLFTDISRMFQLRGIWWEDAKIATNVPYYGWSSFFNNPFIIFISFMMLIVIFYILLIKNKPNKSALFFLVLYFLYFAASTGISFFPFIYTWSFNNIPYFYIFREPWPKFVPGVIFAFASFIVVALDKLDVNKLTYKIIYGFLIIALLIKGYPFFSSNFYLQWRKDLITVIPHYWLDYRDWTLSQKDSRIFPVPFFTSRGEFKYNWYTNKIGNTDTEMPFIFSASNIVRYYEFDNFSSIVSSSLANKNFDFIKLGRIDYILLQDDLTILDSRIDYSWQKQAILKYSEEKPLISFGNKLFIYKIKAEYRIPAVYIPIITKKTIEASDLTKINILSNINSDTAIYPIHENAQKIRYINDIDTNLSYSKPQLEYQKINPTKYKVIIHHAQKTFPLILEESFNEAWKIYLDKPSQYIDETHHLIVNGSLNSWIVNPNELCKSNNCKINPDQSYDMNLTIEYVPQGLFTLAYKVDLSVFAACLLYSFYFLLTKLKTGK